MDPIRKASSTLSVDPYRTSAILIEPGLQDGKPTLVTEASIFAVNSGESFIGYVFAGPIPDVTSMATLTFDGDTGDVLVEGGWARFRGPMRPLVRSPRIVSGPRTSVVDVETLVIEGLEAARPEVFLRMTREEEPPDLEVPPVTVEPDPSGAASRSLIDRHEYVQLVLPAASMPELTQVLRLGDLPSSDALVAAYEAICEEIKNLACQVGP